MRNCTAYLLMVALAAVSCQREEQVSYASLSISPIIIDAATRSVSADDMTVFIDGENFHQEYAYSQQQLTDYLKDAGFTHIEVYADRKFEAPREGEQRIYLKARKGKIK